MDELVEICYESLFQKSKVFSLQMRSGCIYLARCLIIINTVTIKEYFYLFKFTFSPSGFLKLLLKAN